MVSAFFAFTIRQILRVDLLISYNSIAPDGFTIPSLCEHSMHLVHFRAEHDLTSAYVDIRFVCFRIRFGGLVDRQHAKAVAVLSESVS